MHESPPLIPELKVTNFKRSLDFYCTLCGFAVLYDRPDDDFAMLQREGAQIMIEGIDKSRTWKTGELEYPLGRGLNLQIRVTKAGDLYNHLKQNSYPLFAEPEEKWYRTNNGATGQRQFLVQDPDGYLLRFYEHLGNRS